MAIDQESFNARLYVLLKVRGYDPVPKNSKNERSNPQLADVFEFTFKKDGESYGKVWATIDQASQLKLYYDEEQASSPPGKTKGLDYDDSWSGFLKHLKRWTLSKQLDFDLQDSDRLGDDMRQRDYYKMKEKMNEGYHPINNQTSYSDSVPNVKIVIQHDKKLEEGDQRFRNIAKIYVENVEGERFLVPTTRPGIARVYGRHVAEGGTPYDERGKHLTRLVEEYTKMADFIRATKNGEFTESVQQLVNEGAKHYQSLKETLQKMQSHRGYNHYFESWTPALMEDEHDPAIAEMFFKGSIDPRIESVLPILNKLNKQVISEMEEVNEFTAWAKELTEDEKEQHPHKCCGSDVKKEDCNCPPNCKSCNCNAKLDESAPHEQTFRQMSNEDLAEYVFPEVMGNSVVYKNAVEWVKQNREEAEEAANEIAMDGDELNEVDDDYDGDDYDHDDGSDQYATELRGLHLGDVVKANYNGKTVIGKISELHPTYLEVELELTGRNAGKTVIVDVRETEKAKSKSQQGVAEGTSLGNPVYIEGCAWEDVVAWLEKNVGPTTVKNPNWMQGWFGKNWQLYPARYSDENGRIALEVSADTKLTKDKLKSEIEKACKQGVAEGSEKQLTIQQLATISDEALDKAYGYGRSTPGNSFGWQANLMSAAYAKKMIDAGVTDIEKISDAIHKGWNVTAQKFVQDPDQFGDTEKLRQAGKLESKLQQRAKLMKINYAQLDNDEQEKDRVVARALLQALTGHQGVAEGLADDFADIARSLGLNPKIRKPGEKQPVKPAFKATPPSPEERIKLQQELEQIKKEINKLRQDKDESFSSRETWSGLLAQHDYISKRLKMEHPSSMTEVDDIGSVMEDSLASDAEISRIVSNYISSIDKDSDYPAFIKQRIKWLKQEAKNTKDTARRSNLAKEVKLLSAYLRSGEIPTTGGQSAYDTAVASAEKSVGKFGRGVLDKESDGPTKGHVSIARALAGIAGAMGVGPGAGVMAEGDVIPFRKPANKLATSSSPEAAWQQVPQHILDLAKDWYWMEFAGGSYDAVTDPNKSDEKTLKYQTALLKQKGWTIDFDDDYENITLTSKDGKRVLLPIEDAQDSEGWAEEKRGEERIEEFDMSGWNDNRPKKYNPRLVDIDSGKEIKLPAVLKTFRNDEVEIVSFEAPHKPSSTGRVYTKDGNSYFPSVVNAKIVDHEWDDPDNMSEDLDDKRKNVVEGKKALEDILRLIK